MKDVSGGKAIHWGKDEYKPSYWPSDIPFNNIKSVPEGYKGTYRSCLISIIEAIYRGHGYDIKSWIKSQVSRKVDFCAHL